MTRKISKKYLSNSAFLFALLLFNDFCFAQPVASPDIKCISVSATGDVTLNWVTPADPGGNFLDYKIFSSLSLGGPYSLVTSVGVYSQTTYIHAGAGAYLNKRYYLIQTEYNPGAVLSAPADTFSTMFLTVNNPGPAGVAQLAWNQISLQSISTSTGWYKIYMEYPIGTWKLHDSTQVLAYNDKFHVCNDSIRYRVEVADLTGCISVSSIGAKKITDGVSPTIAPLDTVSVNPAGNLATISWNSSPSPDVDSIVIYKSNSGTSLGPWSRIATVPYPVNSYTNTASLAGTVSELYRIAFVDSCTNISAQGIYHKTIYLSSTFDICASTASLVWNKYVNWTPAVSQYEIFKSINGGPFVLIANNNASDTDYVDSGLQLGTSYCYFVRATNGTKTSSSNRVCFSPNVTQPPKFTYNRFATVLSPTSVLIKAHVDPAGSVSYYRLQRATGTGGIYSVVNTTVASGQTLTYTDKSVNTSANLYRYKWEAMDSCQHVIMSSNIDTTILLGASITPNLDIILTWNHYGSFLGKVDHYEVYRSVDGVWGSSSIASVPFAGKNGTYKDDVAPFLSSRGFFEYYVEAIEGPGDTFGFADSSASNIVKVNQYPKFYVPNSFTPNGDGNNDVFLPIIGFIEPDDYSMTIFDNTGTPCFETHDPAVGWDGKKKGHPCMENVYMYLIKCRSTNGEESKISGTLSLFR